MSINRETGEIKIPLFNNSQLESEDSQIEFEQKFVINHEGPKSRKQEISEHSEKMFEFSRANSKGRHPMSLLEDTEFMSTYRTNFSNQANQETFGEVSTEFGLKFLLFRAMSSMEFKFVRKIGVAERYRETMELQKELGKKLGYETNVEDIGLDNDEYHQDTLKATRYDRPKLIQPVRHAFPANEGGKTETRPDFAFRQKKNDDMNLYHQSARMVSFKEPQPKKVHWKMDFKTQSIKSISNFSEKVESFDASLESVQSDESGRSVYQRFLNLKENFVRQSTRSLKSLSRIVNIYRNRHSLNILTHQKPSELNDNLYELEVSCMRFRVSPGDHFDLQSGLIKERVHWRIRRTLTDFRNLFQHLNKKSIIADNNDEIFEDADPEALANSLKYLCSKKPLREKLTSFHSFISLSVLNFQEDTPSKLYQFPAEVNVNESVKLSWMGKLCGDFWVRRWIFLKREGLGILQSNKLHCKVTKFFYFSNRFRLSIRKKRVKLRFDHGLLQLRFGSELMLIEFVRTIYQKLMRTRVAVCNRFLSFSNPTFNNNCELFLNGQKYFSDLHASLQECRFSLEIIGWGLSPFIFLKRPIDPRFIKNLTVLTPSRKSKIKKLSDEAFAKNEYSRLDIVLLRLAQKGVKIRILLYHESAVGLGIDSELVRDYLESLSPLIQVVLLREHFLSYWVVHEKAVIIDKQTAFLGGIDLVNGRWDTDKYSLFEPESKLKHFPGNDFSNVYQNKKRFSFDPVVQRSNKFHRMPFRDVQCKLAGSAVEDIMKHFEQIWQFSFDEESHKQQRHINSLFGNNQFSNQAQAVIREFKRKAGVRSLYSSSPFSKFEKNLLQNIEKRKTEFSEQLNKIQVNTPDNQSLLRRLLQSRATSEYQSRRLSLRKPYSKGSFTCQFFRSSSFWNIGHHPNSTERSAYYKVIDMILTSKKFLYMENQFFISNYFEKKQMEGAQAKLKDFYFSGREEQRTRSTRAYVHNRVIEALYQRILRAHESQSNFVCCLVLNLMPDFWGDFSNKMDKFRIVMDVTLNTLSRGPNGLIPRLTRRGIPWKKHLKLFGLKNHGRRPDAPPCCESVYVHSKVIIQDDHEMLVGSVNLNDRSLLGDRDSELALSLVDSNKIHGKIDGEWFQKSEQIVRFRKEMMHALLQQPDLDLDDFLDPVLWEQIERQADVNQRFYLEVFGHSPDSLIRCLADIER